MNDDIEQRIRHRAHQIWEAEGKPIGRERVHWERATREIAEETEDHMTERDDASDEEIALSDPAPQDDESNSEEEPALTRGGTAKNRKR